jgi:hypothetical protein
MQAAKVITGSNIVPAEYTCVHLRRGDFVDAGWLGNAGDTNEVASSLKDVFMTSKYMYIATDEVDSTQLQPLLDNGAMLWSDIVSELEPSYKALLEFGDYVGLVEQMICTHAKRFIGSKCSTFTGGIYNLRAEMHGDYNQETVEKFVKLRKVGGTSPEGDVGVEDENDVFDSALFGIGAEQEPNDAEFDPIDII